MGRTIRIGVLAILAACPALAADRPAAKVPRDAPYCAPPGTRPVFVAPMGEAFRAAPGEPYPSARWFARADADHDGRLDRAEMVADARRFFATIDLDHDGRLTPEEVAAYERDVAPEIALFAGARDREMERARHGGGAGEEFAAGLGLVAPRSAASDYAVPLGAGRYGWLNIPEPVASADTDVDRLVSAAEFAEAAGRRFDALDKGGTGALALAGLGRTPQQIAIEGPCRPRPKPKRRDPHGPFDDPPPGGSEEGVPR